MLLEEEWNYFHENHKSLTKWYPDSFLVIKQHTVYGGFSTILEAYLSAVQKFELGTFLVLKTPNKDEIIKGSKVASKSEFVSGIATILNLLLQWEV